MGDAPNYEPAFVTRYRPVLETLVPCCPESEARARIGMLYLRDRAVAGQRRASSFEAARVLSVIETMGCMNATAPLYPEGLDVRHRAMIGLMSIATMLEVEYQRALAAGPVEDVADAA